MRRPCRMPRMKWLPLLLIVSFGAGCRPHFPRPYTAAMLAQDGTGPALVHFLGQRDASPSVCDPKNTGPHMPVFDEKVFDELTEGLTEGRIGSKAFYGCVEKVLAGVKPARVAYLMDSMGAAYRKILKN